ncbi:MAG: hypothetical protein AAGB15_04410 [Pseudomonadota bacterium]
MSETASSGPGQSLGIGSIVSDSFALTFQHFFAMLLIMIVPLALLGGLGYLLFGEMVSTAMIDPTAVERQVAADPQGILINYGVMIVVMVLALSFVYAAIISLVFDAKGGRRVSIGSAISVGLSRSVPLFVMSMVVGVLVAVVIGVVVGLIASAVPLLGGVVALFLGFWVYGLILPFPAAVVVERLWFGALGRSIHLTAGYRWPIVLLFIVFALALLVVQLLVALLSVVGGMLGIVGAVITAVVFVSGIVIIYGAGAGMIALVYARLREIKEGTSMDVMADVFD